MTSIRGVGHIFVFILQWSQWDGEHRSKFHLINFVNMAEYGKTSKTSEELITLKTTKHGALLLSIGTSNVASCKVQLL
jgi:hypothetical protein